MLVFYEYCYHYYHAVMCTRLKDVIERLANKFVYDNINDVMNCQSNLLSRLLLLSLLLLSILLQLYIYYCNYCLCRLRRGKTN